MAVTTTGSTVLGLVPGLAKNTYASGTFNVAPGYMVVVGNPDGVVTSVMSGLVAYDIATGSNYMAEITGGSTWFNIGSVAA
jgi:hypothetical protein